MHATDIHVKREHNSLIEGTTRAVRDGLLSAAVNRTSSTVMSTGHTRINSDYFELPLSKRPCYSLMSRNLDTGTTTIESPPAVVSLYNIGSHCSVFI